MCLLLQGKEAAGPVSPSPGPCLLQCTCGHLPSEYHLLLCLSLPVCLRAHGGLPAVTILVRVSHLPMALLPGVRRDAAGAHCSPIKCLLTTEPYPTPRPCPRPRLLGRTPGGRYLPLHLGALPPWLPCLRLGFWTFPRQTTRDSPLFPVLPEVELVLGGPRSPTCVTTFHGHL